MMRKGKYFRSLMLPALLATACSSDNPSPGDGVAADDDPTIGGPVIGGPNGTPTPPADPTSLLNYSGDSFRPSNGIYDFIGENRGHFRVDFQVSDGRFQLGTYSLYGILYTYWFAVDDSIVFTADLYSSRSDTFDTGRYEHASVSNVRSGGHVGQSVFAQAKFGIDFNGDGEVDDDEDLEVVGGSITVSGEQLSGATLDIDVLLVDGQQVIGRYASGFEEVD